MPLLPAAGPTRLLAVATFVNTFGNGLFVTGSVLFFTRSIGLSPGQVGVGLTVAAALGLVVGIPAGHLADRRGAKEVLIVLLIGQGAAMACLALVHSFAAFLLVGSVYTVLDRASSAVRQGLVASALPAAERVSGRAYLRSVTNLGIGLGSAFAGIALQVDTRPAYIALVLGDAVTYWLAAVVLRRLPGSGVPAPAPEGGMLVALRDRPYVVVTALGAVVGMHYVLLEVAVPLWITRHTSAPRWMVAVLFLVNTVCCVLFQVRAARSTVDIATAAIAVRRGALLLAASCVVFALASGRAAPVAIAILLVATLVNVWGELYQAAGSWGLGFGLADEAAQGQYQGLYSTGFSVGGMLGPIVVTALVLGHGVLGWTLLGCLLAGAGILTVPAARWAEREQGVRSAVSSIR